MTLTSAAGITLLIALLAAVLLVGTCVSRHIAANQAKWRPPPWWSRSIAGPGLRNSVRDIDAPCPFDVTSVVDARAVTSATRSPKRTRRVG